jgi:hypothetical protein
MAKGRIRNRLELRAQAEAAERRQQEGETEVEEEEEDEDAEESDEEEAAAGEEDEEAAGGDDDEAEEEAPKKKKPAKTTKAKPRTRTPKVVRLKAVWKVFDNSNKPVAVFDYAKREEANQYAAKLTSEKKGGSATFFVQMVKEPMEEKKES